MKEEITDCQETFDTDLQSIRYIGVISMDRSDPHDRNCETVTQVYGLQRVFTQLYECFLTLPATITRAEQDQEAIKYFNSKLENQQLKCKDCSVVLKAATLEEVIPW